ncbi:MAG: tetratricopeptide repeat protein [Magnetococcus sp. WYHC-3]
MDGEIRGMTPLNLTLVPGEHSVVFTLQGHESRQYDLRSEAAATGELSVTLKPESAAPSPGPVVPPALSVQAAASPASADPAAGQAAPGPGAAAAPAMSPLAAIPVDPTRPQAPPTPVPSVDAVVVAAPAPAALPVATPAEHSPAPQGSFAPAETVAGAASISVEGVGRDKEPQSLVLYREGNRQFAAGHEADAVNTLTQALQQDPESVPIRELLAKIMIRRGDLEGAMSVLSQGLRQRVDPVLGKLYAHALVRHGRVDSAVGVLERTRQEIFKPDAELNAFLAALYQRVGRHWDAISLYEVLLRDHSGNGVWWMGIGISLEAVGQRAEALNAYQRALDSGQLNRKLSYFTQERLKGL